MVGPLDPVLLESAVGHLPGMPSPDELADALAEAELAVLQAARARIEYLVPTAWSLFAVATSRSALERYGVERQRAAFRVSAHIFELSAKVRALPYTERLQRCFAAQVGYLRSELNPSTVAVHRQIFGDNFPQPEAFEAPGAASAFLGCSFLALRVEEVWSTTLRLREQLRDLGYRLEPDMTALPGFGAPHLVAEGTRALMRFMVFGVNDAREESRRYFLNVIRGEAWHADRISRWVAAHLLDFANDIPNSSIWTVLPPSVPSAVRRAFTLASPPVLSLWPPQIELLAKDPEGNTSPLSRDVRRLIVSMPTSSGKTLFAQLLVTSHLGGGGRRVCYVAPTRTLCREVLRSMRRRLRFLANDITGDEPPWTPLSGGEGTVEVMTPERLAYLMRSSPDDLLGSFDMFIIDEVHNVGDPSRGWTLESTVSFLLDATKGTEHRIALLSAAIGNRTHFVHWLGEGEDGDPFEHHSDWSGTRRLHCAWTSQPDWSAVTTRPIQSTRFSHREVFPLVGSLVVRFTGRSELHPVVIDSHVGQLVLKVPRRGKKKRDDKNTTRQYMQTAPLISHLAMLGPVLAIAARKDEAASLAGAVARLHVLPPAHMLTEQLRPLLGSDHPLLNCVAGGAAYHHSSLPRDVREAVEVAYENGELRALVATTTLTEGVNLPAKSVVVVTQGIHRGGQYEKYIVGPTLLNAIGRAGRALKETEGIVVLAASHGAGVQHALDELEPSDEALRIMSPLVDALEELSEYEQINASEVDKVFLAGGQKVRDFQSFVWFLSQRDDDTTGNASLASVLSHLKSTLAWRQLDEDTRRRWEGVSAHAVMAFNKTNRGRRRRWASAGMSLVSAAVLERLAGQARAYFEANGWPETPHDAIMGVFGEGRLAVVLGLTEAQGSGFRSPGSLGNASDVKAMAVLEGWLDGADLRVLANRVLVDLTDERRRLEEVTAFASYALESYLPWVYATVAGWICDAGPSPGVDPSDASYIRWGVSEPVASMLIAQGSASRQLASRVAEACRAAGVGDEHVLQWLGGQTPRSIAETLGLSRQEVSQLVDGTRFSGRRVAAELLRGDEVSLDIPPTSHVTGTYVCMVSLHESAMAHEVRIRGEDGVHAVIPAMYHADLAALLGSGHSLSARLDVSSSSATVTISLTPVET